MIQKTIRGILWVILSAAFLCTGIYAGGQRERSRSEKTEEKFETVRKIAVVNLDEGVIAGSSEKSYYSQALLQFPSDNFEFTGLEIARNGIYQGKYAAYILVPSTFSQGVESINYTPEQVVLEYSVNPNLKEQVRELVLKELQKFQANLSERITYVYVSAILSVFHEAQDASKVIMNHDEKDLEQLQGVQAEKLLQEVVFPQLERSEYMPEYVNLDECFALSRESVHETKMDAISKVELGLDTFHTVKQDHGTLDISSSDVFVYLDGIYPGMDGEGDLVYENGLKQMSAAIDTYNTNQTAKRRFMQEKLSLLSENQRTSNQEYLRLHLEESMERMQEYNDIQVASMSDAQQWFVDDSLREIQTENQNQVDQELLALMLEDQELHDCLQQYVDEQFLSNAVQLRELYEQQANEQLREILNATPPDATPPDATLSDAPPSEATPPDAALPDAPPSDATPPNATPSDATIQLATPPNAAVTIVLEQSGLKPLHLRDIKIALKPPAKAERAAKPNTDTVSIKLPAYRFLLEKPDIVLPKADADIFHGPALEIEELYHISNEEVAQILEEEVIRVIAEHNTQQYTGLRLLNEQWKSDRDVYEKSLDEYNPYYYLELDTLEVPLDAIGKSLQDAEDTMNKKAAWDNEFTQEIYDNSDKNIETLQNGINEAQKQTAANMTETMAVLKKSREGVNQENVRLLDEFTRKLSYTRVGSLGNTEAYDFIVMPVASVEKSSQSSAVSLLFQEENRPLLLGITLFLLAVAIGVGRVLLENKRMS